MLFEIFEYVLIRFKAKYKWRNTISRHILCKGSSTILLQEYQDKFCCAISRLYFVAYFVVAFTFYSFLILVVEAFVLGNFILFSF